MASVRLPSGGGRLPLVAHAFLLLVVLLAIGAVVGHGSSFISDEGGAMTEARLLADGSGWLERPRLLHALDPKGSWYPLENSDRSGDGFAPFAKHPAYAVLAAGAYRVAGPGGVIFLSVVGTTLAALGAAVLARRLGTGLAVPCLWITGLLSPLLFDGFLALGSTLAAALAVGAVLACLQLWGRPTAAGLLAWSAVATAALLGATLLRTESAVFALALALALLCTAVRRHRPGLLLPGAGVLGSAFAARLLEVTARARILGAGAGAAGTVGVQGGGAGRSFVDGRLQAFYSTWIVPSHPSLPRGDEALILAWVLTGALAVLLRRRTTDVGKVVIVGTLLLVACAARVVVARPDPVPGLLIGFTVGWAAVLLLRRRSLSSAGWFCLGTAALFGAGVALTQYTYGEWMSRFFLMGVPVALPPLLVGASATVRDLSAPVRRVGLVSLLVAAALVTGVSVGGLRAVHRDNTRLVRAIAGAHRGNGEQVVVTLVPWIARQAWPTYGHQQWLLVSSSDFPRLIAGLRAEKKRSITLATVGPIDYAARFEGWRTTAATGLDANGRPWRIWSLEDQIGS